MPFCVKSSTRTHIWTGMPNHRLFYYRIVGISCELTILYQKGQLCTECWQRWVFLAFGYLVLLGWDERKESQKFPRRRRVNHILIESRCFRQPSRKYVVHQKMQLMTEIDRFKIPKNLREQGTRRRWAARGDDVGNARNWEYRLAGIFTLSQYCTFFKGSKINFQTINGIFEEVLEPKVLQKSSLDSKVKFVLIDWSLMSKALDLANGWKWRVGFHWAPIQYSTNHSTWLGKSFANWCTEKVQIVVDYSFTDPLQLGKLNLDFVLGNAW